MFIISFIEKELNAHLNVKPNIELFGILPVFVQVKELIFLKSPVFRVENSVSGKQTCSPSGKRRQVNRTSGNGLYFRVTEIQLT